MNRLLLLIFFSLRFLPVHAQDITIYGRFTGSNLYFKNNLDPNSGRYCTDSVRVNGKRMKLDTAQAFEVDLKSLNIEMEDTIRVELFCKPGCKPQQVMEMFDPKPTFEVLSMSIDEKNMLHFSTTKEYGKLIYIVEQFRWNKWVKVGEVTGNGDALRNDYVFQLTMMHSGLNKYRLKQIASGPARLSAPIELQMPELEVDLKSIKTMDGKLEFTADTMFEVFDQNGNIVAKGFGKKADLKKYGHGLYYVCFDNVIKEFYYY